MEYKPIDNNMFELEDDKVLKMLTHIHQDLRALLFIEINGMNWASAQDYMLAMDKYIREDK